MGNISPIRVMIVDDSLVFCRFLSIHLPKTNPRIQIIGYASNGTEALQKVPSLKPDVITLDIEMPGMNGIEFLKKLLPEYPIPVVLSSSLSVSVFDMLSYGAVDFVKKPDMSAKNSTSVYIQNIASKIEEASTSKVRRPIRQIAAGVTNTTVSGQNLLKTLKLSNPRSLTLKNTVIAIGASTGGTEATLEVLKCLPSETPGIVVTQHMPEGFTRMYAERLNRLCAMEVKEAKDGDYIEQGRVLIAPGGDYHMRVERAGIKYCVRLINTERVNGHKPSVDVLFSSVAKTVKGPSVGIILTGMGNDGAKGLLQMRQNNAFTIGQDQQSCVVYGMPMEAYKLGAVCKQASCSSIASVLINHLNSIS